MGLGNLCLTAARRAADGDSLESIVEDVIDRARPHQAVRRPSTPSSSSKRGGRIGNARALLGIDAVDQAGHRGARRCRRGGRQGAHPVEGARRARRPASKAAAIEHLAVLHGNAPDLDELLDLLDAGLPARRDHHRRRRPGDRHPRRARRHRRDLPGESRRSTTATRSRTRGAPSVDRVTQPTPGRVLGGRYRLVAPIARGGMATVWSRDDPLLARPGGGEDPPRRPRGRRGAPRPVPPRGDRRGRARAPRTSSPPTTPATTTASPTS